MIKINRKIAPSTLVYILVAASWLLAAQPVYAADNRVLWVWSMADDIVLDEPAGAGSRATFFSFCEAPGGDTSKAIKIIYLSGNTPGKDLVTSYSNELRGFLAAAHSRGFKVECLQGDKNWAIPDYGNPGDPDYQKNRTRGEERCDEILDFNKGGSFDTERFDGIHYDVEPYLLRYSEGDPYDWDKTNALIWSEYLTLLTNCQAKVDTYNASYTDDINFGGAIPRWYDTDDKPGTPYEIQTRIDYVAIMDYQDTRTGIITDATTEINNGVALGNKPVFIGVETAPAMPPDVPANTFYEEGNTYMEEELTYVANSFNAKASFGGIAIHYYEDKDAGEKGYRSLCEGTYQGHPPIVEVIYPNGDEGIEFTPGINYNITWRAFDLDKDDVPASLKIDIYYSSDGGTNWTLIPGAQNLANGSDGKGSYAWNTADLAAGSQYRIKLIVKDLGGLTGYDVSDYNFAFSTTVTPVQDWATPTDTGVDGARPIIIPDGDTLHMVWYWPGWGPGSSYAIYYKKSTDRGSNWGEKVTLAEDLGGATGTVQPRKPALAVRGKNLAVVWVENATVAGDGKKVKVRISSDGGNNWDSAVPIQGDYTYYKQADFPDITIDASNNIHVVWGVRYTTGNQQWEIHYKYKPSGGAWAGRVNISETSYWHVRAAPAIISDTNGILHVVWGDFYWGTPTYWIKYRKKSAGGSWSEIKDLCQKAATDVEWAKKYFPDIYSDSSNKLHVVWQYTVNSPADASTTSNIYYTSSTNAGDNWTSSVSRANGFVPVIGASGGELRLIYYRPSSTPQKGDIRYQKSANGGSSWSAETAITDNASTPYFSNDIYVETMVGFPSITSDSLGNMVVSWRGYPEGPIMFSYKDRYSAPTNVFANLVPNSSDSLKVTWKKPPDYTPNFYSLYRSVNGQPFSLVATATPIYDVEYIDTGLSNASYYKYKITATEGTTESLASKISNVLYPGANFLVDYFEGYEGITYTKAGTSTLTWPPSYDTGQGGSGRSIKLNYTYAGSGWGAALQGSFPTPIDISGYDIVRFWAKSSINTPEKKSIAIQFKEAARPEGWETWTSPPITTTTNWQQYELYLTDFKRIDKQEGKEGNFAFDRKAIDSYQIFFSATTPDATYWMDGIELTKAPPVVTAEPSSVDFGGELKGSISDHRFVTVPINVKYSGFDPPWAVRLWTNNNPSASPTDAPKYAGLKGADGVTYMPLKVWCVNYGPSGSVRPDGTIRVPDEENDYFWSGYDFNKNGIKCGRIVDGVYITELIIDGEYKEADYKFDINGDGDTDDIIKPTPFKPLSEEPFWLRIPEKNEMDSKNVYTWRRLCWNNGLGDDAGLAGDFNIYLAIDVAGKKNQQYQTTTLTVEYINE